MHKKPEQLYTKYAPYFLWAVVILAALFLLRNLQPRKLAPTFTMHFKELYARSSTLEIADFGESENWSGNYTYDSVRTFDGEVGMNIFSSRGQPVTITRLQHLNLAPYDKFYAYLYIPEKEALAQIDRLNIGFRDEKGKNASAKITGLNAGWNLVTLPKTAFAAPGFDWKSGSATYVELASKDSSTVQIALDRIWAQGKPVDTSSFASYSKQYVNLKTVNRDTFLHLAAPQTETLVFSKQVKRDFSYTAAVAPLKFGTFGLAFQTDKDGKTGYFFTVEGAQMDRWQLVKSDTDGRKTIAQGELKNNTFEKEAYVWLQAERKGDALNISISFNSQDYVPLAQAKDSSFQKGYVGLLYKGSYLIDSIEVRE